MKHYEFTYLTRQEMDDSEAKSLQDKLVVLIQAKKGTIVDLPRAYKKRLAYSVKKQDTAYVNSILFQMETAAVVDFKKETDEIPAILRALVTYYDPQRLEKKAPRREHPAENKTAETKTAEIKETPATAETAETIKEPEKETETPKKAKTAKKEEKEVKEPEKEAPKEIKEAKTAEKEAPKEEPAKPRRKPKAKAELRDIEEKLDEILK